MIKFSRVDQHNIIDAWNNRKQWPWRKCTLRSAAITKKTISQKNLHINSPLFCIQFKVKCCELLHYKNYTSLAVSVCVIKHYKIVRAVLIYSSTNLRKLKSLTRPYFRSLSFCSDRRCRELADYTYLNRQINDICMILSSFLPFPLELKLNDKGSFSSPANLHIYNVSERLQSYLVVSDRILVRFLGRPFTRDSKRCEAPVTRCKGSSVSTLTKILFTATNTNQRSRFKKFGAGSVNAHYVTQGIWIQRLLHSRSRFVSGQQICCAG